MSNPKRDFDKKYKGVMKCVFCGKDLDNEYEGVIHLVKGKYYVCEDCGNKIVKLC